MPPPQGGRARITHPGRSPLPGYAGATDIEGTRVKISNLVYALAGYVLGARAGRERYDQIVSIARRVAGSQTVQSTAGVARAQVDQATARAKRAMTDKLHHERSAAGGQ